MKALLELDPTVSGEGQGISTAKRNHLIPASELIESESGIIIAHLTPKMSQTSEPSIGFTTDQKISVSKVKNFNSKG